MSDYDTTQKPLRINYVSVDPVGRMTVVIDGCAQPAPSLAEIAAPRPSDLYREVRELSEARRPFMWEGKPYRLVSCETIGPDGPLRRVWPK